MSVFQDMFCDFVCFPVQNMPISGIWWTVEVLCWALCSQHWILWQLKVTACISTGCFHNQHRPDIMFAIFLEAVLELFSARTKWSRKEWWKHDNLLNSMRGELKPFSATALSASVSLWQWKKSLRWRIGWSALTTATTSLTASWKEVSAMMRTMFHWVSAMLDCGVV